MAASAAARAMADRIVYRPRAFVLRRLWYDRRTKMFHSGTFGGSDGLRWSGCLGTERQGEFSK